MLPELTDSQKEKSKWQRTTTQFEAMSSTDRKAFFKEWLDEFAKPIRTEALEKCIPPWLLASILLGEVTAMEEYFGFTERWLESDGIGLGSSVGLGQITVDTAIKYGLTETAKNYDQMCAWVHRQSSYWMNQVDLIEQVEAEWRSKSISDLLSSSPKGSRPGITSSSRLTKSVIQAFVRAELLNPLLGIRASACYLRELLNHAIELGKLENYTIENESPWGKFDFSVIRDPCNDDLKTASDAATDGSSIVFLSAFFGAAHNDDALKNFREGIGLTQGYNAAAAADAMERLGLLSEYNLQSGQ